MEKEYKPIPEFENYGISKDGIIINLKRQKELKYFIDKDGYYKVGLCINKKKYNRFVHRLVAITYIDNPNNLPTVDHIDGNRTNNSVENLRWATYSENSRNTKQNRKIKIINENTGETKYFDTLIAASEYLNIDNITLCKVAKINSLGIKIIYND